MQRSLLLIQLVRCFDFGSVGRTFAVSNCPDYQLNGLCVNKCDDESIGCIANCNGDFICVRDCIEEQTECSNECPCGSTCPDGCNDCQNSICKCKDDWNRCIDSNGISLGRCIYDCKNDQDCEMECLADFKSMQDKCPCESNCPNGCPCDDYDCTVPTTTSPMATTTTTTTTTTFNPDSINTILVLDNGKSSRNDPLTIDLEGNVENDFQFGYGENTETYDSCGATINGQLWVIGGWNERKQISRLTGLQLQRVGSLDFNFARGACGTYQFGTMEKILLCFNLSSTDKKCHTFNGILVEPAESTIYEHYEINHLASYRGNPMTTGGSYSSGVTEIMNLETGQWIEGPEVYGYSTASTDTAAYIVGGYGCSPCQYLTMIAAFKDDQWEKFGDLVYPRRFHSSITWGSETVILGGQFLGSIPTEVWNFNTGQHRTMDPILTNGEYTVPILSLIQV